MRTPDHTNAAQDTAWVNYGAGHMVPRQCDDSEHVGGRKVMQQMGGKVIKRGPLKLGWRCPVCVARRAAAKAARETESAAVA